MSLHQDETPTGEGSPIVKPRDSFRSVLFPIAAALIAGALCLQILAMLATGQAVVRSAKAAGDPAFARQHAQIIVDEYFARGQRIWTYGVASALAGLALFAVSRKPNNARWIEFAVVLPLIFYVMLQFLII